MADYFLYVKFKKETMCLYDTELDPYDSTIFELRIFISNLLGLPLSIFRLKSAANVELFDESESVDIECACFENHCLLSRK